MVQSYLQKVIERQHSLVNCESIEDAHNRATLALMCKSKKENPAKGRVSWLLVGRVSLFPLREEALLTN